VVRTCNKQHMEQRSASYLQLRSMIYDGGWIVLANDTSPRLLIIARCLPRFIDISSWVILELQEVQNVAQSPA